MYTVLCLSISCIYIYIISIQDCSIGYGQSLNGLVLMLRKRGKRLRIVLDSGHAESVQVEYDPAVVSYEELLQLFWQHHRPKPSEKGQYRSSIWYHNEAQRQAAEASLKRGTQLAAACLFHKAEAHHQTAMPAPPSKETSCEPRLEV